MDAISCLPPPAAFLAATSFTDAAALHYVSTMSADSSSNSSSSATNHHQQQLLYSSSSLLCSDQNQLAYAPVTCDSAVLVSSSPSPSAGGGRRKQQQLGLGPAGGRAGKRRSRASKRAPTTYITTDPTNFRLMVQHITGAEAEPGTMTMTMSSLADSMAFDAAPVLLAADTNHPNPLLMVAAADEQQQQQQPCFPTLDSWNVTMYHRNDQLHLIH